MESEVHVFIGMVRDSNLFVLGQVLECSEASAKLCWVARVFEVQSGDGRIGYQFHPDPYFTNDSESMLRLSDFLIYRVERDQESKIIREYKNFLMQLRIQKSGLISGQVDPEKMKSFIK